MTKKRIKKSTGGAPGKQNLDAAEALLRRVGRPMRVGEMLLESVKLGIVFPTRSDTPASAIHRDLACDVRLNASSRFVKVAKGTYSLRELEAAREVQRQADAPQPQQ